MRSTPTVLVVGATALGSSPAAIAAPVDDPPTPLQAAPLAGHTTVAQQMRAARQDFVQQRLARRAMKLARGLAHARHDGFSKHHYRVAVAHDSPARLATRIKDLRHALRTHRANERRPVAASTSPMLAAIAACESGGNPATDTGNGFYGKYQFTQSTWESVGGSGNPAIASEAEQNQRAAALYAREGASPWPVCGR